MVNAYDEIGGVNYFGRVTLDEVMLLSRLYRALQRLNLGVPQVQSVSSDVAKLYALFVGRIHDVV